MANIAPICTAPDKIGIRCYRLRKLTPVKHIHFATFAKLLLSSQLVLSVFIRKGLEVAANNASSSTFRLNSYFFPTSPKPFPISFDLSRRSANQKASLS